MKDWKPLLFSCILVLGIWVLFGFFIRDIIGTLQQRALFGDSFGVINTLFSGLAFAGIIGSLYLQRKDLQLTKNELAKAANAQQATQKALNMQVRLAAKQAKLTALQEKLKSNFDELAIKTNPVRRNILRDENDMLRTTIEKNINELTKIDEFFDDNEDFDFFNKSPKWWGNLTLEKKEE